MTTNVPLPTFTPTGVSVPAPQAVLAGVQQDWSQAFAANGKTLNTELTTPQGQLQQSQSYMVSAFFAALAQMVANVDPMTSSGTYQDALGRINFLTRQQATFATVPATVVGTPGQLLPAGALAASSDGSIWATTAAVTFGPVSTAAVTFQATVAGTGPAAGTNDLTIYQQQPGWESVSNSVASTPGTDTESRQTFEQRRSESVQIGGVGQAANVRAAVGNVTGVTDAYVYNNGGDAAIVAGTTSYPIPAHSIAVIASGGDNTAIATAINSKLDCGCGLPTSAGVGTLVTVNVQDTVNYVAPFPTYQVRFVRPQVVQVYFTVNVANLTTLPSDYVAQVQQAMAETFSNGFMSDDGTISVSRARIGGQLVAAEYAAPILALGNITPVALFVGTSANPLSGASLTLGIDQQPVTLALNVTVAAVSI
jgi:uncharacterized phage protein gp47/JayE